MNGTSSDFGTGFFDSKLVKCEGDAFREVCHAPYPRRRNSYHRKYIVSKRCLAIKVARTSTNNKALIEFKYKSHQIKDA